MSAPSYPPTACDAQWERVRDLLFSHGRPFKSVDGSQEQAAFRCARAMNQIQQQYHHSCTSVGVEGRRLAETALVVLLGRLPKPTEKLDTRIGQFVLECSDIDEALVSALDELREFGNRAVHDGIFQRDGVVEVQLPDLKPTDMPAIVAAAYTVAQAVVAELRISES